MRRRLAALSAAGAFAVVVLIGLSPLVAAGTVRPSTLRTTWFPSDSVSMNGCGRSGLTAPHFSVLSLAGRWSGSASASTCSASRGGATTYSSASASASISVQVPVKLTGKSTGLNVTWKLNLVWSLHAKVPVSTGCKGVPYTYSYYDTYISSWVNTTYVNSYCSAYANVNLYGQVYLVDMTTGSYYYPTNYWSGIYHQFSQTNNTYSSTTNYSNPNWWSSNYTSWSNYGSKQGASGSGNVTPANSPTWFINGTFVRTDTYVLNTYLDEYVAADISGLSSASTSASLNAATSPYYEDLSYVVR